MCRPCASAVRCVPARNAEQPQAAAAGFRPQAEGFRPGSSRWKQPLLRGRGRHSAAAPSICMRSDAAAAAVAIGRGRGHRQAFCDDMLQQLFAPRWAHRHGAAVALRSVLLLQAACANVAQARPPATAKARQRQRRHTVKGSAKAVQCKGNRKLMKWQWKGTSKGTAQALRRHCQGSAKALKAGGSRRIRRTRGARRPAPPLPTRAGSWTPCCVW